MDFERLKKLLSEGQTKAVIEELSDLSNKAFVLIKARFSKLQDDILVGVISYSEQSLEFNRINQVLANFISHLEQEQHITKSKLDEDKQPMIPQERLIQKVCFIASEYPPAIVGGLGIHVNKLSLALSKKVDLQIVLPENQYNEPQSKRINIQSLYHRKADYSDPISWLRFSASAADRIIRFKEKIDVVHCHDWLTILAGIKVSFELKIPLVFHLHLPYKSRLGSLIENLGLMCSDLVTVNSEAISEDLKLRNLRIAPPEIIGNGVDLEAFKRIERLNKENKYILFVGRLEKQKGVKYLINAFSVINKKFPHLRLKIVGKGSLKNDLIKQCDNLYIRQYIDFEGWKNELELLRLYNEAEMLVIPSIYEPFGIVALEAMACECPVVASNVGGLKEIVTHGKNGYLFENKNYLDLASWIMALLSDSNKKNNMISEGKNYLIQTKSSWDDAAEKYFDLYNKLTRDDLDVEKQVKAKKIIKQITTEAQRILRETQKVDSVLVKQLFNDLFNWLPQ